MDKRRSRRAQAIRRKRIFLATTCICLVAVLAVLVFTVSAILKSNTSDKDKPYQKEDSSSQTSSEQKPKEPYIVGSATVVNTGDILVHSTVLDGAKTSDGGYDFSSFFPAVSPYFKAADLAVINLEVTFGGTESGKYNGYPSFNCPDSLADTMKKAGINTVLTANNHSLDNGVFGLKRTVQVLKQRKLDFLGTKETESDPTYIVKNVNGVKIGMVCYTYPTNAPSAAAKGLINTFSYNNIEAFYTEAQSVIESMKTDGADAIVFYIHWGNEYQLSPNTWQKTISQKLSNLGVDIIVGGHPHVLQPMDVIYSENSEHTTVCLYSMGNSVSNQRQELMDSCPSGHTEDGLLFYYTFDKYSDGTTVLSSVDLVPTWVNKYKGGSGYQYKMIPLEENGIDMEKFLLTETEAKRAQRSFDRTKALMEEGLKKCQEHLGSTVRFAKPTEKNKK